MTKKSRDKELDQFYTTEDAAASMMELLQDPLFSLGVKNGDPWTILEPSAGTGVILDAAAASFPNATLIGSDLDPKRTDIERLDFLDSTPSTVAKRLKLPSRSEVLVLGNPPFGKKGVLAGAFLTRALELSEVVGFILPIQFRRYLTQSTLPKDAALVFDQSLPKESFVHRGKPYSVRCCVQLWTTKRLDGAVLSDLRRRTPPPKSHPDFELWIYNCTPAAMRVFDEDWSYAVRRQGWGSFSPILRGTEELSPRIQWMLFRPNSTEAEKRLLEFDFEELAEGNTSVKGFGKADFVEAYSTLYPDSGRSLSVSPPSLFDL